jgi:putative membrane protein
MKLLLTYWSLDFTSIVLLLMIMAFITAAEGFSNRKIIISALIILIICLFSPLHILSAHYLFSAHMIVHVLLLLCMGPLLVMSLPQGSKTFQRLFNFLKHYPVCGWMAGVGVMWFWHIPVLFNSAMSSMHQSRFDFIYVAETLSLIFAGILFSAPVIHPNKNNRIDALTGVVYLFTACIGCSLLGLLITFAPVGTYHHFLSMHDVYGLNNIILNDWRVTQSTDQQAAGLIMWVPCCLVYVTGAMYLLMHWFKQKEEVIAFTKKL